MASRLTIALIAMLVGTGCVRIDSGHRGVLFKWFGGTQDEVFPEGVHIVAPWNRMMTYDVRMQDRIEKVEILTSNGLSVRMDISVRFRLVATPNEARLVLRLRGELAPRPSEDVQVLGTTAALLDACRSRGVDPDAERLRVSFEVP